jgi:hypothetical protein
MFTTIILKGRSGLPERDGSALKVPEQAENALAPWESVGHCVSKAPMGSREGSR